MHVFAVLIIEGNEQDEREREKKKESALHIVHTLQSSVKGDRRIKAMYTSSSNIVGLIRINRQRPPRANDRSFD